MTEQNGALAGKVAFVAGVHARGVNAVRGDGSDRGIGAHVDPGANHSFADARNLEGVGGPLRHMSCGGDQCDGEPSPASSSAITPPR